MRYFPIYIHLEGRDVLVIGGGEAAAQKLRLLLRVEGIRITIIAPTLSNAVAHLFAEYEGKGILRHTAEKFSERVITRFSNSRLPALIYSTDESTHADAVRIGRQWHIPVNAVDSPRHCDFITPALVDRSPVVIAIGTEGCGPILAQEIRGDVETRLDTKLGALARYAGALRDHVMTLCTTSAQRRDFWRYFFTGLPARHFYDNKMDAFHHAIERGLSPAGGIRNTDSTVFAFISIPSHTDLLTLRAYRFLQDADVLLYETDILTGQDAILDYARRDAQRILLNPHNARQNTPDAFIQWLTPHIERGKRTVYIHRHSDDMIHGVTARWTPHGITPHVIGYGHHIPALSQDAHPPTRYIESDVAICDPHMVPPAPSSAEDARL